MSNPTTAPSRGLSIASLVLGIASVFFGWTFIAPIVGFILGIMGLRREPAGKGMAWAGIIINGLILFGWIVVVILVVVAGGIGAFFAFS